MMTTKNTPRRHNMGPKTSYKNAMMTGLNRLPLISIARSRLLAANKSSKWHPKTISDVYSKRPDLVYPFWLKPIINELESFNQYTRLTCHAPIQHGKTTLFLSFLILCAYNRCLGKKLYYITYSASRAEEVQFDFLKLCEQLGIEHRKHVNSVLMYLTVDGKEYKTSVYFGSIDGSITGKEVTGVMLIDDPIKGVDSKSDRINTNIWRTFRTDIYTRCQGGICVIMSRWSVHDLTAKLNSSPDYKFRYLRLAAECDEVDDNGISIDGTNRQLGQLLWPEQRNWENTNVELRPIKNNDVEVWSALYQGKPLVESQRIIDYPEYFESLSELPQNRIVVYGLDGSDGGDFASIYRLEADINQKYEDRIWYVTAGMRNQGLSTERWAELYGKFVQQKPGPILWHTGGQEKIHARFIKKDWLPTLTIQQAKTDPYTRSLDFIKMLNLGRIKFPSNNAIPNSESWVEPCIEVLINYVPSSHKGSDDLVALNSAFYLINQRASGRQVLSDVEKKQIEQIKEQQRDQVIYVNPLDKKNKTTKKVSYRTGFSF